MMKTATYDLVRRKNKRLIHSFAGVMALFVSLTSFGQDNTVKGSPQGTHVMARTDAQTITIGDHVRVFIEATNDPASFNLNWPVIPDTFNSLEVVERSKIDTIKQAGGVMYKQRIIITGFDSGLFKIPAFPFVYAPKQGGSVYMAMSDSFQLMVNTVKVDTTQAFKGIKGIMIVKSTWKDYIGLIAAGIIFIGLVVFVVLFFINNRKAKAAKRKPQESLQDYALRLLNNLEAKQLWQKKQVKEYYIALTDIVRNYVEHRFDTTALEITTEELLEKVQTNREMQPYYETLAQILQTADLAKFAKFQPAAQEHTDIMEKAKLLINTSRPIIITEPAPGKPNNPTA